MFLFFLILFILFLVYKDDIRKTLLTSVNQKISGEITFSELSFTPFRHFPNAALVIENLCLNESKDSSLNSSKFPVFDIKEAYISVNMLDLLSSKINVSEITFENGSINAVVYPDSQTNLEKAIKKVSRDEETVKVDTLESEKKLVEQKGSDFSLQIDNLELTDISITAENQFKKNKVRLKINQLQSEFSYKENQIVSSVSLDTHIDSLIKNGELLFSDEQINLESNLEIDTDSIYVKLEEGSFSIGEAKFLFNGIFDSKNEGYVDLTVTGSDENFSLLTLLIKDDGIKNLKSGEIYFNGSVKGKTVIEFPAIEISFGVKDIDLINPITKREIKRLNLKGYFESGKEEDWSSAKLIIDTLYADLPDGVVGISASIRNLTSPEIEANLYLSADVTGLEKVFKLGPITDLKGKIEITDRVKGRFDVEQGKFESQINNAKINFENFGLKVPNTILFDKIDGVITRNNNDIQFADLKIISEDTDFIINGEVKNAFALLFNREEDIACDLQIKSKVFDLPNFLSFDPSIKRDFNYRILDVDVSVVAKTTTSKATKFKSFPEIEFDIKKIYATAENFLPRLNINSGVFKISEDVLGFNLKYDNFKTKFLGGDFNFTGEYNTSKFQPFYIKAKTDFNKLNLSELFYSDRDSVPESMQSKLSGKFFVELQFPTDSTALKFVNLKNADLTYVSSRDTIITEDLHLNFNKIYFNDKINPNLFATMYFDGNVKAKSIKSGSFNFNDVDFTANAINGSYEIKSELVRLFGENAKGRAVLTFAPFSEIPSYRLNLENVQFQSEKMLKAFMEDTVISGPLKLTMDVRSTGSEWNSIVNNLNGTINLSGENLLLIGIDADKLIENFQESQNFNLVDLGGAVLAGPIGIVVTKGSDYATLLVAGSGEKTQIKSLVSNWDLDSGELKIKDAAFSTNKNRLAAIGYINISQDSLDLTIALLNSFGCSAFSQRVYGNLNSPTMEKIKVVGTVLAPVTNLVDDVLGKECEVFYQGAVEHPK